MTKFFIVQSGERWRIFFQMQTQFKCEFKKQMIRYFYPSMARIIIMMMLIRVYYLIPNSWENFRFLLFCCIFCFRFFSIILSFEILHFGWIWWDCIDIFLFPFELCVCFSPFSNNEFLFHLNNYVHQFFSLFISLLVTYQLLWWIFVLSCFQKGKLIHSQNLYLLNK